MDASTEIDVVVLEQYHVEESDAVVHASAYLHGFLLQHTHAWRRLAGIEDTCLGAGIDECLLIFVRHCGDATHALQDIEHQALRLQKALHLALDAHHDVAGLDVSTILDINLDLHFGVEAVEHLLGNLYSSKDAFFLDKELAFAHFCLRNATQRRVVAVTDILGKGQVYQPVVKFFY